MSPYVIIVAIVLAWCGGALTMYAAARYAVNEPAVVVRDETDTTEEQFDAMWAAGEPVALEHMRRDRWARPE